MLVVSVWLLARGLYSLSFGGDAWLGAVVAAAEPTTVPGGGWAQLGVLGLVVAGLGAYAKTATQREQDRADAEREENRQLYKRIEGQFVPALQDSGNALRQALELVTGLNADHARMLDTLQHATATLEETRAVMSRFSEIYLSQVASALREGAEVSRTVMAALAEMRREQELRERILADFQKKGGSG